MTRIADIGTRIELVPMDGHFHDITVALYQEPVNGRPTVRVHTYSAHPGVDERLEQIRAALTAVAGVETVGDGCHAFPCGDGHDLAVRRAFLEACKLDPATPLAAPSLQTVDRKSGLVIHAESLGDGQYRIVAEGAADADTRQRRVGVIVNGLLKLGDMRRIDGGDEDCVAFPCSYSHDALVGLLLQRAPNVRALVREQQAMAARGVLSAPSAKSE